MPAAVMQLISSLGVGGAERLLIDHVTAGRDLGRRHVVVVMNTGEEAGFRRELQASGAPVLFLDRRPGALSPTTLWRLLDWARRHEAEILHSHNPGSLRWSMLMKAARPSLTLAHTLHGMDAIDSLAGLAGLAHQSFVSGTVAVSPSIAAAANGAGLRGVTCIDNGVALSRLSPAAPRPVADPLRLICVGRIAPEKGQDILIEAVHLSRARSIAVEARLVGDAAPEHAGYLAELKASVLHHGLQSAVVFEPGRTDVPDVLRSADAFVLPSRREGFGLALVEAMATGLPVIASDVGGPAGILRNHSQAGLLFTAGSPVSLADRIAELATNDALRLLLAAAAPQAAIDYDIGAMAARYDAFYAAL